MEEDLVAVGVGWNAGYVAVGFAADPFGRMGLFKELEGERKNRCQWLHTDMNSWNYGKLRFSLKMLKFTEYKS